MYARSLLATAAALVTGVAVPLAAQDNAIDARQLDGLRFRSIGPAVTGGRIHDVEAVPSDPSTIFVASATGGIWKTTNRGTTWTSVFDDFATSSLGDLAIAPSNPNVIWAGTGGQNNRQSTAWGNGVYRSTDGGETWTHLGLTETRHIGRVRVHPTRPDVAYVAALGNLWRSSQERGVYKTSDGGRTWQRVLYVDSMTGAVDLVMAPDDPDVLYAAMYQRQRRTWGFNGGGPGSGIYKTIDGGRTWEELTAGIPLGDKGRIGLAIAETNPNVLNALIEHSSEGGTFRSTDAGATWTRVSNLNQRPMYYSHIVIDPTNENRVYELATNFTKSENGGRDFRRMPTNPTYDVGVHADYHSLWIDPSDSEHFYLGGDGGLFESWDRGETYRKIANLPIGQFYAIGVDFRDPYYVYGGMQDNHSWMGPNANRRWIGIINDDWKQIGFGDGMYHQPDPTSTRYEYGGSNGGNTYRLDTETGDLLNIRPVPPAGERYRFDWAPPIQISKHDPRVVYLGGNRLFISRDRGETWERTEDLTKQVDRDTLTIMGVAGADIRLSRNDGTSSFGELVTIAESPLDPSVLWVGADDGNIQVSRDGGRSWTEVSANMPGVPAGTYVSRLIASTTGPGAAYATLDAHRDGDFRPYVLHTEDYGRRWQLVTDGLPADGSVNVIVEHPRNPDLLFVGTEHGLFVTVNRGRVWTPFKSNFPTTLVDDLVIHPRDDDLVIGTHGRSLWILDDLSPLVEWSADVARTPAHLFSIDEAYVMQYWKDTSYRSQAEYAGENPAEGALLSFTVNNADNARIEITNQRGRVVRTFEVGGPRGAIQRVAWDLRHAPPPGAGGPGGNVTADLPHPVGPRGPFVSPGRFTATLIAGGARSEQTFQVRGDPKMPITDAQYREREAFLLAIADAQRALVDLGPRGRALARRAGQLASQLNGSGVRQGSLYPPTATQRQQWEVLRQEIEALLGN